MRPMLRTVIRSSALAAVVCWQPAGFADDATAGGVTTKSYSSSSSSSQSSIGGSRSSSGEWSSTSTTPSKAAPTATSSEEIIYKSRYGGVRGSNKFVPKFRERINNLKEQIEMGLNKGWLSADRAAELMKEHAQVDALEVEVSVRGFEKAELDQLEKAVTLLAQHVHQAGTSNQPAAAAQPQPQGATAPEQAKQKEPAGGAAPQSEKTGP